MSWRNRVIWSQGMFLQPHHFQQQTRFIEHLLDTRVAAAGPFAWGFAELMLDEAQLATGQYAQNNGVQHNRGVHGGFQALTTGIGAATSLLQQDRVLDPARRERFRFLHVSTDEVFGSLGETGAFSETTPYDPRSPYSASKAGSDHLVSAWHHTYGLPVLVTNCSNNYGPYQFPEKLIPLALHRMPKPTLAAMTSPGQATASISSRLPGWHAAPGAVEGHAARAALDGVADAVALGDVGHQLDERGQPAGGADALDRTSYERLMGTERAQMVFADAPYNVKVRSVVGRGRRRYREFGQASGETSTMPPHWRSILSREMIGKVSISARTVSSTWWNDPRCV